jgi:Protein of unknown function (DUF3618)
MTSSTQLERTAERARERLSNRLEDLRYHVSPATLASDLLGVNARAGGADEVLPVLVRQARSNPMACLLIAAGVGWLLFSESRGRRVLVNGRRVRLRQTRRITRKKRDIHNGKISVGSQRR